MQSIFSIKAIKRFFPIILIAAYLLPLIITLKIVLTGNTSFWYDNARDLLSAWDNLEKATLIGPTSGIPGIFYGPYWIWLLSIGLAFSKDPRVPNIVVGILPYFTLFPIVLFLFSKHFGKNIIILVWLLFIFTTGHGYVTNMWNPHLAPLLFLLLIYLLVFTNVAKSGWKTYIRIVFTGVIAGLIVSFHISFGIGVFLGVMVFYLMNFAREVQRKKQHWRSLIVNNLLVFFLFFFGALITALPFFAFEFRHGFNQMKAADIGIQN